MNYSPILQSLLKELFNKEILSKSPSTIRNLLEDKIDFAQQNTIDFHVQIPNGDILVAKEDIQTVQKYQKVYNIFMDEYMVHLDQTITN